MIEIEVKRPVTPKVDRLRAECGVRYWGDATVNGEEDEDGSRIPLRMGDYWCPTIVLATGQILDWPQGVAASIHYKVCDDGRYRLLTTAGETAYEWEGYVPSVLCPKSPGYGDYVIMDVGADGVIFDWPESRQVAKAIRLLLGDEE